MIYKKIREFIDVKKISVDELGRMSGIKKATIHNIVKGETEMKISQYMRIVEALKVPMDYFISEKAKDSNMAMEPQGSYFLQKEVDLMKKIVQENERYIQRLEKDLSGYENKATET